jgi:hypothetical protein
MNIIDLLSDDDDDDLLMGAAQPIFAPHAALALANIIDLLSDDDDDDLLMGAAQPIFTPRAALAPATNAAPAAISAPSTTAASVVATAAPEHDSKPHATILIDDDDALLMGAAQPIIFASSVPHVALARTTNAVAVVAALEQDSKPHVTILGSCHLSIVGTQYHTGKVSIGESVKLEREPTNVSSTYGFRQRLPASMPFSHLFRYSFAIGSPATAIPFELKT